MISSIHPNFDELYGEGKLVPEKWKVVKEKIYRITHNNEEETLPDLRITNELFKIFNTDQQKTSELLSDISVRRFFQNDFIPMAAKYLLLNKSYRLPECQMLHEEILLECVRYANRKLAEGEDNPKLCEIFKIVLNPEKGYYKTNFQDDDGTAVFGEDLEVTQQRIDWINSLKVGDHVDALKIDHKSKRALWSRASITEITADELKVTFERERKEFDRALSLKGFEFDQHKLRTSENFDWRFLVKKDQLIDVCDTVSVWYTCTVLDTREVEVVEDNCSKKIFEIHVGYRVYSPSGDRSDERGKFSGWYSKYDEWINVTNPRVHREKAMAKKLCMMASKGSEDPIIEDSNDNIYDLEHSQKARYAITRAGNCKSKTIVKFLNTLGEEGFFNNILKRISDTGKETWCPIDILAPLIGALGCFQANLFRPFAINFVPKLKEVVFHNLLESPDSNIRNFTKDRIENVVTAMELLLKRGYSLCEKIELIELFNLDLALICFKSNFLNSKIHGLKAIIDIFRQIKNNHYKNLTVESLTKRINEQKIFDELYSISSHSQLIQRSGEFLRFLLAEDLVPLDKFNLMWSVTKSGNKESFLSIYKVFSDASVHLKSEHIIFIIDKISEISVENLSNDEIELVYEISRFSTKGEAYIQRVNTFMWDLISLKFDKLNKEVGELVLNKYCDLLKVWDKKEDRKKTIHNCIQNLKENISTLSALKIMKKVIDTFPLKSEELTQAEIVKKLCISENLLAIILGNIKRLKSSILQKLSADSISQIKEQDFPAGDSATYLSHISEYINFIQYLVNQLNSEYCEQSEEVAKFTGFDFLSSLWSELVNNSLIVEEKNLIFKWFKDFSDLKNTSYTEVSEFFKKIVIADEKQAKYMTLEGFNCFKSLFSAINYREKALIKQETKSASTSSSIIVDGYHYDLFQTSSKENEIEFLVVVFPQNLEGINFLWNLVFLADDDTVVESAIQLLNNIYINLSPELSEEVIKIRTEYLEKSKENMEIYISKKNEFKEEEFQKKIQRCLQLINYILGESEKNGVGDVKSHSSLVKGEAMSFSVNNDITYGSDVPKKIDIKINSNKTIYDLKVEIARQAKTTFDSVKLSRNISYNNKEIKDSENGRTIGELRLRNSETLFAEKKPTPYIPQVPLVNPDQTLVPAAKAIFTEWFGTFSTNGKMNSDQCADFIGSCTSDVCKGDDRRVKEVFNKYDEDRDGLLTIENFLLFYTSASVERPNVVWSNLQVHHIRNDLKKASEVETESVKVEALPRWIIRNDNKFYHILFALLDEGGKIESEVWKLLNRIPTSPELLEKIVNLQGVKNQSHPNWENIIFTNSKYRLLYALSVIEYLMQDEDEEPKKNQPDQENATEEKKSEGSHDLKTSEIKIVESQEAKEWRSEFILYGGFEQLFNVFISFTAREYQNLDLFDKNILSFILKILKNYLTAALAKNIPHLYTLTQFIRFHTYSLDLITDYLKSLNKEEAPQQQVVEQKKVSLQKQRMEEKKNQLLKQKLEESPEFLSLIEKLQGELANKILTTINFITFNDKIMNLIYDTLTKTVNELESEDRLIVEYGLCIFLSISLHDPDTQVHILSRTQLFSLLLEGIFCLKSNNVRKYFSTTFYLMVIRNRKVFTKVIVKILLENIPTSQDQNRRDCNEFYQLLCKLLEEGFKGEDKISLSDAGLDYSGLIKKVIKNVQDHQSTERRSNPQNDKILIGYLNLTEKIFHLESSLKDTYGDFSLELFNTCLFEINPEMKRIGDFSESSDANATDLNYVKCKGSESRRAAYKLIVNLIRKNDKNLLSLLENGLLPLMKTIPIPNVWNFSPSLDTKSSFGYVGLRNLGCICYMNAMLQQFFMCTTFRYSLLLTDDNQPENPQKPKNKTELVDDNVLHQLQKMFAFLELTDRHDYNPFEFCFSFKDFSGEPVNVSVQQDAQEFLNMIFDKLEFAIKPTPFKYILEGIYGGKTSTEFICSECNYVRSREENFYNLSVGVKTNKTIYESFEKFISGEVISDYKCDNCNKKVDITKRCVISYLPNVLIVHLQRIVFDLDSLMNQKINSRLEFPHELNLEPYTKEGLTWREKKKKPKQNSKEDDKETEEVAEGKEELQEEADDGPYKEHPKDYYEYKLKGVVVHTGTADFGHYYSYINIKNNKWLEFNDSNIRDFDPKNIESECFGGVVSQDGSDDMWAWQKGGGMRETSKNAYILVYERKVKDPLKLLFRTEEEQASLNKAIKFEIPEGVIPSEETPLESFVDYFDIKKFIPEKIYKKVWTDNHKFMLERHIYNDDFFKFIKDLTLNTEVPSDVIRPQDIMLNNPDQKYPDTVYSNYKSIEPERRQVYINMIDLLVKMIFDVVGHCHDNSAIPDLTLQLKMFMSLVPEHIPQFMNKFAFENQKNTLTLLLLCPDKHVKWAMGQILIHGINILVILNDYSLDPEEPEKSETESNILNFFEYLLLNLHAEVAKNWSRMHQFLEFWRDLSYMGTKFVNYLFKKDIVAIMLDFYLEKASPLVNFSEKKHLMGNRFSAPPFECLIQLVSNLMYRVKNENFAVRPSPYLQPDVPLYSLSENAKKCLSTLEFYERTLREGHDPLALSNIVVHMAYENENFSYNYSLILLRGLSRVNFEEAKPYLETLGNFLNIFDLYQNKRLEWVLGWPQPFINRHENFSMISSLEDQVNHYESVLPLESGTSLLNLIYQNRRKFENVCMVCLNKLLFLADVNNWVFHYLIYLPPPSNQYAKYTDWIRSFIENFNDEVQKYYTSYSNTNKEALGKETLKIFCSIESKINQYFSQMKQSKIFPEMPAGVLDPCMKIYIGGKTIKEDVLKEEIIAEKDGQSITLICKDVTVPIVESLPTGKFNIAFPDEPFEGAEIKFPCVDKSSNILNFFHARATESAVPESNQDSKNTKEIKLFLSPNATQDGAPNNTPEAVSEQQNNDIAVAVNPPPEEIATSKIYNIPQVEVSYIRRFLVKNPTNYQLRVTLQIIKKDSPESNNVRIPSCIYALVKPKVICQIFAVSKFDPFQNWFDLQYKVKVDYIALVQTQTQTNPIQVITGQTIYGPQRPPNVTALNLTNLEWSNSNENNK